MGNHHSLEDTQPMDLHDLPTGEWEPEEGEWEMPVAWSAGPLPRPVCPLRPKIVFERVPEPALIRGLLMAAVGMAAMVAFRNISHESAEPYMRLYIGLAPLILAWWIRGEVTPVNTPKVRKR